MRFLKLPAFDGVSLKKAWTRLRRASPLAIARRRDEAAIPRITLHEGGVLLALAPGTPRDAVRVRIRFAGEAARDLPVASACRYDGMDLVLAPLSTSLARHPGLCTVTVRVPGRARSARFEVGPDRYAGRCDGVRDYCLEGWLTPLFPTSAPSVRLLVDGVAGEPMPLDRYRGEFQFMVSGQGGWNGFSLPLPPRALDGKPHRLAVTAGATTIEFGTWSRQPTFHIDSAAPDRFSGWYFDPALLDEPTTLRIVRNGETRASLATHFRADVRAAMGREHSGFAFAQAIAPGSVLVAGPEGTGFVLGRFGRDRSEEIAAQRRSARARLLEAADPEASLAARRAIRGRLRAVEAGRAPVSALFEPAARAEAEFMDIGAKPIGAEPIEAKPIESRSTEIGSVAGAAPDRAMPRTPPPVCAIVPVYKGLADLELCLASLLPQLAVGTARAIVINDASPDPAIGRYLARLAAENRPGLTILHNPENLGFIGTVNRGFSLLEPGEDVLLVNADTILPPDAVARLARHCHAGPGIASVTPMSNNATILSFPDVVVPGLPALGLDVAAIDRAFAAQAAAPVEIPTGIGFCMHLNRRALDEVGGFDPEWGRGYCEEVDWSLTARDLGWIHLAATDIFVVHEGSVSFGVAERVTILATNHARLERLYPEYVAEVLGFIRADPFGDLRTDVLVRLLAGRFSTLTLQLTHGLGGGTKRYVEDILELPRSPDHEVAVLAPVEDLGDERRVSLRFDSSGVVLTVTSERIERTLAAIEAAGITIRIQVNSRLTFRSEFLEALLSGTRPYTVMLHDFQWYCPRVHLTDMRHTYCGEPNPAICQLCVAGGLDHDFADHDALIENDLDAWLAFNAGILRRATRVLAPSEDTARRYHARFDLPEIVVSPHPEPRLNGAAPVAARAGGPPGSLRIAVVGAIGRVKGFDVLVRMMARAERDRRPVFLTVVGYTADDARLKRHGNVKITGSYKPGELRARLDAADPDFVFLPSIWPETYSYVLSEVWEAGYPVVAFDIGAPADRIRRMGGGTVIPFTRDSRVILDALRAARDTLAALAPMRPEPAAVSSLEAYDGRHEGGHDGPDPTADTARPGTAGVGDS